MKTWHIHIEGQVQGVGFRPFVFVLAREYGLNGWVNNAVDGVHIECNAPAATANAFSDALMSRAPELSCITSLQIREVKQKFFDNFQIIHSAQEGVASLLLTPDIALCDHCRNELYQPGDKRNHYPFINCTHCGPRFSIIQQLPYDRINTTMDDFCMCASCVAEYNHPLDRRYFAQTNSCPECRIELALFSAGHPHPEHDPEKIMDLIVGFWEEGKIVAIKGIGGYLLTCAANREDAVVQLRKRKQRPTKPFAMMFPDIASLKEFHLTNEAIEQLQGHVSPIVLLPLKKTSPRNPAVAPGLDQIGVMIPYTPLYDLLLKKYGRPVVATSGNISNAPIVYEDHKALAELSAIADSILVNNRNIVFPQDDSVISYSYFKQQKILLRRSRGLAPAYIDPQMEWPAQSILSMGAMLKSTFSFLHRGNSYISPYLGDLAHFDTLQSYQHSIAHFLKLFNTSPEMILCDLHREYPSTQFGESLSTLHKIPIHYIQHHIAHFGAILGEHQLLHSKQPVLGVIWDGTGLGDDGQIWGGEFFKYAPYDFLRCYHFDYFDFILGDKMAKEPRVSALSACWDVMGAEAFLKEKFSKTEWEVYTTLLQKENTLQTSSVGRLFDAVASLLGIMDVQCYEGEAAMQLEALATRYFRNHGLNFSSTYFREETHDDRIATKSLMTQVIMDLQKGKSKDFIAAKFHYSLMMLVRIVAHHVKTKVIAFSGGVFQNALLVDLIQHHLKGEFKLYFHQELSPNDENISLGQLVCHQIEQQKALLITNKTNDNVFSDSPYNNIHRIQL